MYILKNKEVVDYKDVDLRFKTLKDMNDHIQQEEQKYFHLKDKEEDIVEIHVRYINKW